MRFSGLILGVCLGLFSGLSSAQAAYPDLNGMWHWDGNVSSVTQLIIHQTQGVIRGRISSPPALWDFEGTVTEGGRLSLTRWVPVTELPRVPRPVIDQMLQTYGDPARPGMFRTPMILTYNASKGELRGYYTRLKPTYFGNTLVNVEQVQEAMFVTRGPALPELVIESFTIEETDTPLPTWRVVAVIRNVGSAPTSDKVELHLMKRNTWGPNPTPLRYKVADSGTSYPTLAPGEIATIEWRTDRRTDTANIPNIVERDDEISVVIDPANKIIETDESNGEKTLHRLSCADPEIRRGAALQSIWVAKTPSAVADATPDYQSVLDRMSDPAQAVLCYIRLEAQRLAKLDRGTVAGSRTLRSLETVFFKDYLTNPNPTTGLAALAKLGEGQGAPAIGLGAYMYIPKSVRERYSSTVEPAQWEWLYPATQFWVIRTGLGTSVGNHIQHIPHLDVPFLVGKPNARPGDDADAVYGGKNLSNVMHWATGAKYWYLPEDAMREIFVGYEYWHMEGFDVFGEDSLNDLIAEEQGRMLGVRIARGEIRSSKDLVAAMDRDFRRSRAWVGAMLKLRREKLDENILSATLPQTDMWFQGLRGVSPWAGNTVREKLDSGMAVSAVTQSGLVSQLIEIYQLIYANQEWELHNGAVRLTDVVTKTVKDEYNDQFKNSPKNFGAQWEWTP